LLQRLIWLILSTSKTGLQAAGTVIHKLGVRCNIAARQTTAKPTRDRSSAIFARLSHAQLANSYFLSATSLARLPNRAGVDRIGESAAVAILEGTGTYSYFWKEQLQKKGIFVLVAD